MSTWTGPGGTGFVGKATMSEGGERVARRGVTAHVLRRRGGVEHDPSVEVDVRVLALGALGHLELHVEEPVELRREVRDLGEIEAADVEVVLQPLQVLARDEDVVPPEQAAAARRREGL